MERKSHKNFARGSANRAAPLSGAAGKNPHTELRNSLIVELSRFSWIRVFPNEVGAAQLKDGGWITYGLCKGSSDLIACGHHLELDVGIFFAIECKTGEAVLSPHQKTFRDIIVSLGGKHIVARSVNEVIAEVKGMLGRE